MKAKMPAQVLERVETWPTHAQDALAESTRGIDDNLAKPRGA